MKKYMFPSLKLTFLLIVICGLGYPILITAISKMAPGGGKGIHLEAKGRVVGYSNIGQRFNQDGYFWGRPSAVDYNANGSGGSNKGPTSEDLIKVVEARADTFIKHNPGVKKGEIPSELITASGSGLDPDISIEGAIIQIPRVARVRNLSLSAVDSLVHQNAEGPLFGLFGPSKVNVLKLNLALNSLNSPNKKPTN